ncbi:MAG TPA: tyrosine--tRNA ligase [Acidimicrobiales bacterium]|nr:tyrosine--tRNA ligase [Acidimicrobiales bacterium]
MAALSADLAFRGLIHQVTDPSLPEKLDRERLTAYIGFDPTADSLHVGHLLQMCNLRRLQLAGHRPIALAGGGTGMIGDPGGKSEERNLLSVEELTANVAGIRAQLERFLDFSVGASASQALLVDNSDWLGRVSLVDFLRDTGKHFTVNQMVAKESVRARLDRPEQGISYTEFSYMLLQAYDFQQLFDAHDCRLQLGGSDQWGNITMGIELIRKTRQAEVFGLTTSLLLKADGTKFGKTESGAVWLDARRTSPYQLYQYFLRTEDATVGTVLRMLTFLDHDTIGALDAETAEHPERREAQRALAHEVCSLVHGETEAVRAEEAARALYSEEIASLDEHTLLEVCADAPTSTLARAEIESGMSLVDALVLAGLAPSKGRARTTITQGGAYVNNRRVREPDARLGSEDLLFGRHLVLRRGQRDYHLLRFE